MSSLKEATEVTAEKTAARSNEKPLSNEKHFHDLFSNHREANHEADHDRSQFTSTSFNRRRR
jgi:hypothetical protein